VSHFDLVDHRALSRIDDLERGAAGVEDHYARVARTFERGELGQPECVAVEGQRRLEFFRLDDEPKLQYSGNWGAMLHAATVSPEALGWHPMATLAKPIKINQAFDDPAAIRRLVEGNGPYPSIASYLPPSATGASSSEDEPATTLPWFRGNWVVNGQATFSGAEEILRNPRFAAAAARLFGTSTITPTTVVVNVNAPMSAGAVHVDIPSFAGANRDHYSLRLLQAMGTSGLFEPWRVVEAGAVSWFYDGPGGAYDYWPDGLDGAMHSERPPFDNVALVADNDRMFHRIGWVGDPAAPSPSFPASTQIEHTDDAGWSIIDAGQTVVSYPDSEVRISILWKAQVHRDVDDSRRPLTPDHVIEIFTTDLRARGIEAPPPPSPLTDSSWIDMLHSTYYPAILVNG
jgi:hypothetical protein